MPNRPFSTEQLRYELRMKPFLGLQPPEAPPFADFKTHTQPYSDVNAPDAAFQHDVKDPASGLWSELDAHLRNAKEAFGDLKKIGARAARAGGVSGAWGKGVQSALASCVALGVAVAGVKAAAGKRGEKEEGLGVSVEIPEAGTGKRYAEGWVVVKIAKV